MYEIKFVNYVKNFFNEYKLGITIYKILLISTTRK